MNVYEKTIIPGTSVVCSNIFVVPPAKLLIAANSTIKITGKAKAKI
jgi:hypothetical protein